MRGLAHGGECDGRRAVVGDCQFEPGYKVEWASRERLGSECSGQGEDMVVIGGGSYEPCCLLERGNQGRVSPRGSGHGEGYGDLIVQCGGKQGNICLVAAPTPRRSAAQTRTTPESGEEGVMPGLC